MSVLTIIPPLLPPLRYPNPLTRQGRQITISITAPRGVIEQDLLPINVGREMTIADLKAVIQGDTKVSPPLQRLYYNDEELLDDSKTLEQCRIQEDAMLAMRINNTRDGAERSGPARAGLASRADRTEAAPGRGSEPDPELIRLQALGDPQMLANIRGQNPMLANAVPDPNRFRQVWENIGRQQRDMDDQKQRELALLNADPFNVEAQAKIEEIIREERVMENVQSAMDYAPEVFGRVHMLYIPVEVNNHCVKAFVDSGAQATIMSPSCAESCGIMRLIDKRFAGIARGVGTAQILGRVHWAQIKIGSLFLPCSFTVMEGKDVDLLLGLDMLKRHQASIDLLQGALIIQDVAVPFLGEADIPKEREPLADEPTVAGPSGMRTGAISGAVSRSDPTDSGPKGKGYASGSGAAPGITASAATPSNPTFPPEDIKALMDTGLSREQAVQALEVSGGNVFEAASMYFS